MYDMVGMMVGNSTAWALARLSESGKVSILHQFSGSDGAPTGLNLTYGADGNIYGIGNQQPGRIPNSGFIFRLTRSGTYSQLVSFPKPLSVLWPVLATDGSLYALFSTGGTNDTGELWRATLSGQLQSVVNFPATVMTQPVTMMQAVDGNLYGSTNSDSFSGTS